jgi:hypothetical protein
MFGSIAKCGLVRSAAAAGLMLATGSAPAPTYKGSWDPLFCPPFANLWWRGSATFDTGPCVADGAHVNAGPTRAAAWCLCH